MGRVSDALTDWFETHAVDWPRREALLEWADAQGDDLRRAWEACARGDDLMGLAGALQPPLKRAVVMTGRLVRPTLANIGRNDGLATRVVYLAENWGASTRAAATKAIEQFEGHAKREGERFRTVTVRLSDACADAVGELVQSELSTRREDLTALSALEDLAWIDVEAERAAHDPATLKRIRALGVKVGLAQREVARISALTAVRALARSVDSAHAALEAFAGVTKLSEAERAAVDDALVQSLAEAAVKAESDVYAGLARTLEVAANASAHGAVARWCESEGFVPDAARALFETAAHQLSRPGEPLQTMRLHVQMERVRADVYVKTLAQMADELRAQIPFEALARADRYV